MYYADVGVGLVLFGDGAGALVVSLDHSATKKTERTALPTEPGIFEVVNCVHTIIPHTENTLTFDVCPEGWKETISPQLPNQTGQYISNLYRQLRANLPDSMPSSLPRDPTGFDWPIHTGGSAILQSAAQALALDKEHLKASWEVYETHGNTSSSSVLAVLETSRRIQEREWVISMAFGPGIVGEGILLRRIKRQSVTK
ncbi:thiolase-like protein [Mycena capillaripes]|nr:thiolase-like protein [Mycena capillaripes]